MRIVLDTNVLARAVMRTSGLGRELLLHCTENPHVLVLSEFIIAEVSRVLRYPRMRRAHGLSDQDIEQYIGDLRSASAIVLLPEGTPPAVVPADPGDDPVVATAVVGQATVLCSLDRHLHQPGVDAYCRAHGVEVIKDVELMQRLRESNEGSDEQ